MGHQWQEPRRVARPPPPLPQSRTPSVKPTLPGGGARAHTRRGRHHRQAAAVKEQRVATAAPSDRGVAPLPRGLVPVKEWAARGTGVAVGGGGGGGGCQDRPSQWAWAPGCRATGGQAARAAPATALGATVGRAGSLRGSRAHHAGV